MERENLIQEVSNNLKEIYEKYSPQGVLSLYIWGSILTPDFNPETSDIDTIAIVNNDFSIEYESKIQKELAEKNIGVKKLGFRFIYKSELDTGIVRSPLGTVGIPVLLLLDLPTWKYVCGTVYKQTDFLISVPTLKEAIRIREESTKLRWPNIDLIKPEEVQYFVKQILRIIHLKQLERSNLSYSLFSYSGLKQNETDPAEVKIIDTCLKIKASNWDLGEFRKSLNGFKMYTIC